MPPKMLFRGFEFSAISVPSCEAHNQEKHGDDQGFITALRLGVKALIEKGLSSQEISIATRNSIFSTSSNQVRRVGALRQYIYDAPDDLDVDFPYLETTVDLYQWIRLISAGLMWARFSDRVSGIAWDSAIVRSPNFVQSGRYHTHSQAYEHAKISKSIIEMAELLEWISGWYRNPKGYPEEIYHYFLSYFDEPNSQGMSNLLMRHTFYRNFTFYLMVDISTFFVNEIFS